VTYSIELRKLSVRYEAMNGVTITAFIINPQVHCGINISFVGFAFLA
jgi:hypothetical protein